MEYLAYSYRRRQTVLWCGGGRGAGGAGGVDRASRRRGMWVSCCFVRMCVFPLSLSRARHRGGRAGARWRPVARGQRRRATIEPRAPPRTAQRRAVSIASPRGVGGGGGVRGCRYGDQASRLVSTSKDNTGEERTYVEGMVFPTLAFPSDHGITTVDLLLM